MYREGEEGKKQKIRGLFGCRKCYLFSYCFQLYLQKCPHHFHVVRCFQCFVLKTMKQLLLFSRFHVKNFEDKVPFL